jgi:hypothetical protein
MDAPGDDHRWLSYSELAQARSISRPSAVRLVRKHRWPRRTNNAGVITVAVPVAFTVADDRDHRDRPGDRPSDRPDDRPGALAVLAEANARADEANKRADVAVALADRTLVQLAEAHTENGKLRDRLDQARGEATEARQQAEALRQAEAERAGKGRWARLRAAWRGR